MSTVTDEEYRQEIRAKLQELPPADWVLAMIAHYQRTGTYRPEDLHRLLGDPNKPVILDPNADMESFFSACLADPKNP